MYYVFETKIDLKKAMAMGGNFSASIPFFDVVIDTKKSLSPAKIETIKTKIATLMTNKFNLNNENFIVELKSEIK